MANTSYTLIGDLGDLLGGDLPTQGLKASVITNLRGKALADRSTGGQVRLGDGPLTLDTAGKFTVTLIGTDSTELNVPPGELRYQVVVERGRGLSAWYSGEFELTGDADLKDKVGIESPALTSTLAQRAETAATEAEVSATEAGASATEAAAEAARAEAAAEVATAPTDATVSSLLNDSASSTSAALADTLATTLADGVAPVLSGATIPVGASEALVHLIDAEGALLRTNAGWAKVQKSTDDGSTWVDVGTAFPMPVIGLRQLDNGELLAGTADNFPANTVKSALWRSSGYGGAGTVAWTKVLEASDYQQGLGLGWGFGGSGSTYAVSEYDSKAPGSRSAVQRAWLTTDAGQTWAPIYDHGNGSLSSRHIHGVGVDPYRPGTIWLTLGDYTGSATGDRRIRVSRDNGATWADVTTRHQPTAIMCFPNAVAFGMDNAPNGVLVLTNPDATPDAMRFEMAYRINTSTSLTHVAERPFRAPTPEGYLTLLPFTAAMAGVQGSVLGSYDGRVWFEVWREARTSTGAAQGPTVAVGPTRDGKVHIRGRDESAGGWYDATLSVAPFAGVAGLAARLGAGLARQVPRRAFVAYNNFSSPRQTATPNVELNILLDPNPGVSDDPGGLFTRASDGTGLIVNRDAVVRIEACAGRPLSWDYRYDTFIKIDAIDFVRVRETRVVYSTRVRAGQKIAVWAQPNGYGSQLSGFQALAVEAWEV